MVVVLMVVVLVSCLSVVMVVLDVIWRLTEAACVTNSLI